MIGRGTTVGRGRARLVTQELIDAALRGPGVLPSPSPDGHLPFTEKLNQINSLFLSGIVEPLAVYRILYACLLKKPTSDKDVQHITDEILSKCITDSLNADTICKYYYLLSRHKEPNNIRQHFYNSLEKKFNEREEPRILNSAIQYRNFCQLFMYATHFMRHPSMAPIEDIVSGLLKIISRLPTNKDRLDFDVHSQAVVWCSSYLSLRDLSEEPNNRLQRLALGEAMNVIRERLVNGDGSLWDVACLETASAGGTFHDVLDYNYYILRLREYQIQLLSNTDIHKIVIPSQDQDQYNLDNLTQFVTLV